MRKIEMGMSKEQFAKIMEILDGAFPRRSYTEEKVLNAWYRFMSRYDPDVFESVVDRWIINSNVAPTIADLKPSLTIAQVHKYRDLEKEDGVKVNTYIRTEDWTGK